MTLRARLFRLLTGLIVLGLTLAGGFALFMAQMPRWGATPAEAAQALPGDALLSAPMINWTNARTVNIGNGAFIMEQRMMNGIKAHAQGWVEPTYQEAVEIALWVVALLAGLAGAVLFVARRPWIAALAVAVVAVGVILVFTFAQPSIAVRVLLDGALLAGVWAAGRKRAV